MSRSIVLFTVGFSLAALVTSQISSIVSSETCGYIDGGRVVITACKPSTNGGPCPDFDRAIECTSRSCGFLFIWSHDNAYAGCCGYERCAIATTCIESGTALNSNTIQCTDGSLSACATYTWPQLSAEAYFCATARTTVTVVTETRDATSSNPLTFTAEPTIEPSRTDGGGSQPTDAGGPNLGTESDLSSRQRIGAGVGSGLAGGLMLIFFAQRKRKSLRPQADSKPMLQKDAQAEVSSAPLKQGPVGNGLLIEREAEMT
ncbi:uncharacterized protein FFB20_12554 [Fusarium fujikuroi]|nr:uncharacterized protein FFB20_12554 [Fusarium fujikuroi]SCO11345.1 uncharacterized protein FFE2_12303 [Fusarium fujikuroi]SCO20000.1 uncharacterized protein FFM5_12195 [Fusarium fujikuroi]SCO23307.1 uncharacterized protein FFC1_14737 [Fusarium fujikuroi]SCO50398.1 uncharacterized protein FFNC_12990 [Fusarium fujikuroi]